MTVCEPCHDKSACNWPLDLEDDVYGQCFVCGKTRKCTDCNGWGTDRQLVSV